MVMCALTSNGSSGKEFPPNGIGIGIDSENSKGFAFGLRLDIMFIDQTN